METSITETTPVEYEMEINATAEDMESRLRDALREQRKQMDVQGFRQGKVPLGLVKKMHGKAIGHKVAEEYVQDTFEEEIEKRDDVEPIGQPTLTELDYEVDGELHAVVRFGVRPEVDLVDLSEIEVPRLVHEVGDEDVEDEVERLRMQHADLIPAGDEPAGEEDFVNVDLQRIDPSTDTPIIGDKDEDLTFFLDDDRLKEELREALTGRTTGETFRVRLPQDAPPQQGQPGDEDEERLYEVTVNEVKRRDLPEVDAEFVRHVTEGELDDPDAFRQEIRDRLEDAYSERSQEMVQGEIIDKMLEHHAFPIPESVVETYLDSFENQVRQENDGELPEDFDREHFRQRNRDDAEKQGRWMIIRDKLVEEEGIEVSDEDLQAFFADQAQGDEQVSAQQIEQFYRSMPKMMERVRQQVLSQKVYDLLLERFDVREMDRDEFEGMMQERHERRQAMAGGAPGGAQRVQPQGGRR
jgi:trigger factor